VMAPQKIMSAACFGAHLRGMLLGPQGSDKEKEEHRGGGGDFWGGTKGGFRYQGDVGASQVGGRGWTRGFIPLLWQKEKTRTEKAALKGNK